MPCLKTTIPLGANKTHQLFRLSRDEVAHLETPGNMCQSRQKLKSNCFIFESRLSKKKRSLFPSRSKQLRRFLLRRSWMWSLKRVRHRSPPNFTLKQTVTTGFLAHLLSLLVKRWEDVITGKPEVSNTKQSMIQTSDCKKLEKSRILFSRSSDYIRHKTGLHVLGFSATFALRRKFISKHAHFVIFVFFLYFRSP